jgi:large subunit ribosomal protein L21
VEYKLQFLLLAEIISKVNNQLLQQNEGRLFAVVHICGKQFKVTTEDLIIIEGNWAPQLGDQIKLEKVDVPVNLYCVANLY